MRITFRFEGMRLIPYCFFVFYIFLSCSDDKETIPVFEPVVSEETFLYSSNEHGHNELYRYDNGQRTLVLSDENFDYWWPKVSPDKSKMLVYRSPVDPEKNHDNYPEADLILMNFDGSNSQLIIPKGKYGWSAQGVCRWNKDGSKILMASEQSTATGNQWRLVITDNQGNNPKNLSDRWIIDPNFSIDNGLVVFIGFPDNNLSFDLTKLELHKAEYDSANDTIINITRLTQNTTRDHDPSFSPDGSQIVFSAGNAEYTNVDLATYDVNLDMETELLDDSGANGGSMCWSPDGKEIYFHSLNLTQHPFQIKKLIVGSKEVSTLLQSAPEDFGYFHPESY